VMAGEEVHEHALSGSRLGSYGDQPATAGCPRAFRPLVALDIGSRCALGGRSVASSERVTLAGQSNPQSLEQLTGSPKATP
jgi:hypothetical protein